MAQKTPKVSGTPPPMQCSHPHQLGLLFQNLVVALKGKGRLEDSLNLSLHTPPKNVHQFWVFKHFLTNEDIVASG